MVRGEGWLSLGMLAGMNIKQTKSKVATILIGKSERKENR